MAIKTETVSQNLNYNLLDLHFTVDFIYLTESINLPKNILREPVRQIHITLQHSPLHCIFVNRDVELSIYKMISLIQFSLYF